MNFAHSMQKFQDWFTQQWIIVFGRKINPAQYPWLMGPFGEIDGIGERFIHQLSERENLQIIRNVQSGGLLKSFSVLDLDEEKISEWIIDFYEKTSDYDLEFGVKWNPVFKLFGIAVNRLFSRRINQLNIPTNAFENSEKISSEIIHLKSKDSGEIKYTFWLRKSEPGGRIIYSGIYTTCKLPSGGTCIKAIFPLPKGNATVILKPFVGENKAFVLDSSGRNFGDAGFYFLLNDAKGNFYSQYHGSFTEKLLIEDNGNSALNATQTLKLWGLKVVEFKYKIWRKAKER